ncbi:caspase family protein [Actinokineospora auranticolor]|nr:caspase family protein [Actinokineospora auranticolor]
MTLLHGAGARAVLIGTGGHVPGSGLPDIAAVPETVADLTRVLVDRCGMLAENITVVSVAANPSEMGLALADAVEHAESALLVYYVGHGLLGSTGDLYLASRAGDGGALRLPATALPYTEVCRYLSESRARHRLVVLDCCFSGRAIPSLADPAVAAVAAHPGGTFVMASAARDEVALAPPGARHTAFSGALIALLDQGEPGGPAELTLEDAYQHLDRVLAARRLPRPRKSATQSIDRFVLAPNLAWRPEDDDEVNPAVAPADGACPYPGLASYGVDDARWFFGRAAVVDRVLDHLADRVADPGLLVVSGPSGVGKSSLLRAGVVPALARGALTGSQGWHPAVITPTNAPLASLRAATDQVPDGRRPLLVVDQFEELFTLADEPRRAEFVQALHALTATASVVLCVRADFLPHCAVHPALVDAGSGAGTAGRHVGRRPARRHRAPRPGRRGAPAGGAGRPRAARGRGAAAGLARHAGPRRARHEHHLAPPGGPGPHHRRVRAQRRHRRGGGRHRRVRLRAVRRRGPGNRPRPAHAPGAHRGRHPRRPPSPRPRTPARHRARGGGAGPHRADRRRAAHHG